MKLTIWQQFSSNHSGNYTIVGIFATSDDAKHAGKEIRTIVQQISNYISENWETVHASRDVSEIEKTIAQKYGFVWEQSIDWLHFKKTQVMDIFQREHVDSVFVADRLVFIETPPFDATGQTGHQFVKLFQALGGNTYSNILEGWDRITDEVVYRNLQVKILCIAPNEIIADEIFRGSKPHFDELAKENGKRARVALPWAKLNPKFANYLEYGKIENYEASLNKWLSHDEQNTHDGELFMIASIIRDVNFQTGKVSKDGKAVIFESLHDGMQLGTALSALIRWLKGMGCELSYEFEEK
jgi:hypothetical protein